VVQEVDKLIQHKPLQTFDATSKSKGEPSGNVKVSGNNFVSMLSEKHIAADTTHWYQVTNKGASRLTV